MPTFTATIVITPIANMAASTSFQVSGTYQLNQSTWSDILVYEDDAGTQVPITSAAIQLGISNWSFTHPALPAGTHTVSVQDPFTGTTVISNQFTVGVAQVITANPITGAVVGSPIVFTGSLTNFTTTPVLTYSLDSGAAQPLAGVTTTGWSTQLTFNTAGSHTIVVSSSAVTSNTVTFTVAPSTASHVISVGGVVPAAGGSNITPGAIVNFTGTLTGYTSPPSLTYTVTNATPGGAQPPPTPATVTGVTSSGWSMQINAPTFTGTFKIIVTDGTTSGQNQFTVNPPPKTITPTAPTGVVAGTPFTFQGVLGGYTSAPSLSYSLQGGAAVPMTGVTTTSWAMTITIAAAGTYSITVTDSTGISGSTTINVASSTAPPPTAVAWNPSDKAAPITLSNTNKTATSTGSATAGAAPQGVRAGAAINATKIVLWEVQASAITQNWTAGVANAAFSLTLAGGLGSDANGLGFYVSTGPGSQPPQSVRINSTQLDTGNGVSSFVGDVATFVTNGSALWISTGAMRTVAGVNWNGSTTANPITAVGGYSFSMIGGTYYPTFFESESGGAGILNDGSLPFSAFGGAFLAANTSVVSLSGQITPPAHTIAPATPSGVIKGTPFTFTGVLEGYTAAPVLTYTVNPGGTPTTLQGVTATGWSTTITI